VGAGAGGGVDIGVTDPLLSRLALVEDRLSISQLPSLYALAVDTRDPALMMSLFAESDVAHDPPALGYREMSGYTAALWGDLQESILFVTNHVIQLAGDRATGTVYCLCRFAQQGTWNEQAIRYDDSYVRTDTGWKFEVRRHLLWYGQVQPTNPMTQPAANWPESQIGRGVLPYAWGSWRRATGHDKI
jgi:hypothetical protein